MPPPGTAAALIASNNSSFVAPYSMARRMWPATPYWRPRDAKTPSTISSFTLTDSVPSSPTLRRRTSARAADGTLSVKVKEVLAHTEASDFGTGGGVGGVKLGGPVHVTVAI